MLHRLLVLPEREGAFREFDGLFERQRGLLSRGCGLRCLPEGRAD